MPLPRSIAKETAVEVLHNHQFLIRMLWRDYTIESNESMSNETVADLRCANQIGEVKTTLTNIENGVSLLQELKLGSSLLTGWTVTERATTEGQGSAESEVMGYALQEEHTVQNSPFIWLMYKLSGHHNPWINLVMALLENVAANEEVVSMASGGLSYYDHGKFKHD